MKLPKPLIAAMGIMLVGVTPLLQAAPGQDDRGQGGGQHQQGPQGQGQGQQHQDQGRGQDQQGRPSDNNGNGQANRGQADHGGGRPPQDFGPVRQTISQHRESFGRGNPLPPNLHLERGHPLPRGYGRALDQEALRHLPRYDGYQWRRVGSDIVLVAIGSGLVYEILSGVLN